jgi:class 3 adenylate cyclase
LKRLRLLDRVLVLALVPLWLVCFGLQLQLGLSGRFLSTDFAFSSAQSSDTYPIVHHVFPSDSPSGLAVGDRLIRVEAAELRGLTWIGIVGRAHEEVGDRLRMTMEFERAGERGLTVVPLVPNPMWWPAIPLGVGWVLIAVTALLRVPEWHLSRRVFLIGMLFGLSVADISAGGLAQAYATSVISFVCYPIMLALGLRCAQMFPERLTPLRPWERILPWLFWLGFALLYPTWFWVPPPSYEIRQAAWAALFIAHLTTVGWALTWNYLHTDPLGRRQIKWVLYGAFVGGTPVGLASLADLVGLLPEAWKVPVFTVALLAQVAFPIGVLVTVFGYRFLDIDPLISSTASYSILSVLVLAGLLALVPRLAEPASTAIGVDTSSTQLVLSVALAAIAIPAHRLLRPRIDRFFFLERHALEQGVEGLLDDLSDVGSSQELAATAGGRLDALLRPESCVVYARAGEAFVPVFARGRAVPPAFEGLSPLITTLRTRPGALVSQRFSRRGRAAQLSPFDRAALETLGVAVVVPVRRRGVLVAFLCLGPKRSGDIYTATDLALLKAVADKVATQLELFDDAQVVREARAMQEELRRYVPGAIVRGLESGEDLEPRERAISVLFVDLRGYTSYSESRQAQEIFSTVNRYTQTVSSIVEKLGGSVVEFNGDGVMAVFGAPRALPEKERAAVAAGREIISTVGSIGGSERGRISVGVGIATGAAFVGNVQSSDRVIWTALGNTTNLAARLQGLTRDLDASMVIDLATQRGVGDAATDFERREHVAIRGREQREDVYLLPLERELSPS